MEIGIVRIPPIIEARLDLDSELHCAADRQDATDKSMSMSCRARALNRHEVLHLADSGLGQEARDQHVGVWQVQLLGLPAVDGGRDAVVATTSPVQDGAEDTGRVEARAAVPVNGAI